MKLITVEIDKLTPHPENYNCHPSEQLDELEKSLDQFTQFKNIVITPENVILAGHGLVEAAKRKGIKELAAYVFIGTHEQEKALLLADNATSFLALPDIDKLNVLLDSLPSIDDIPGVTDTWVAEYSVQENYLHEKYGDFDEQMKTMGDIEDADINIVVPKKYKKQVKAWLSNGEMQTAAGMGKGILKRCGLLS